VLSDLLAQLSDVEIASDRNLNPNFSDIGRQDSVRVTGRVLDDVDDDDETAFTHSGALTIKSSRQSLDGFFGNVGSTIGHFAESSPNYADRLQSPHFEPPTFDNNTSSNNNHYYINNDCFNPTYVRHLQPSMDCGGLLRGNDPASDLRTFLTELGLGKYADVFHEQDVDLPMFLTLNEDDLKEVGIR